MKRVKTHTFKLGKYHIIEANGLDGVTDCPDEDKWENCKHEMFILEGNSFAALHCALHEALHAEGVTDDYLHDKDGYADTYRLAKFLWRLGYRKECNV